MGPDSISKNMPLAERVRVVSVETLSDNWCLLKKTTFDFLRGDGTWQRQSRETYDRGNGATILLYNRERRTVILVRQFRFPTFVNGNDELLIETPAGLLDENSPDEAIRKETMEETGYLIEHPQFVFEAYMSPGSVTEKVFFYVAEYAGKPKHDQGGGDLEEGEDIETFEISIDDARQMIRDGKIRDGKTILLLQYALLEIFA
jgi:nudix-type nucleoside diphosphatase (YffH/AdpP family)